MNPDDYCRREAAAPGSTIYYAVREAPAARRDGLIALFALRRELEKAVREISDPSVGRITVAWWRNEIDAACAGTPTHPIMRALVSHYPALSSARLLLLALVDGYELDLDATRHLDFKSLSRYVEATGGNFVELIAALHAPASAAATPLAATPVTAARAAAAESAAPSHSATAVVPGDIAPGIPALAWARALGTALALGDIVRDVGADARYGRIYLPIDDMQRFNVTAAAILNRRHDADFAALMAFQTERARSALEAARGSLPRDRRGANAVLRALVAMNLALLATIAADGYHVLGQRISLTPLRKLWTAWRGARQR